MFGCIILIFRDFGNLSETKQRKRKFAEMLSYSTKVGTVKQIKNLDCIYIYFIE
jgi:hypothetical protein